MTATDNPAYKTCDHIIAPNLVFYYVRVDVYASFHRLDMHVVLMENVLGEYAVTTYKELKYQTTDQMDCGNYKGEHQHEY